MIKIVNKDIFQATENILAHQVNCQGVMGSGIAKEIKERFPKAFVEYKEVCNENKESGKKTSDLLGKVQGVEIRSDMFIANLFGQDSYGRDGKTYTDVEALRDCFITLKRVAKQRGYSIAMPYNIGSDRGGADWREVEDILIDIFDDYDITLYRLKR